MIPKNPYKSKDGRYMIQLGLQKIAWQVCKETHIAWLFSPCTEHQDDKDVVIMGFVSSDYLHSHRYLCPICMKELEESK